MSSRNCFYRIHIVCSQCLCIRGSCSILVRGRSFSFWWSYMRICSVWSDRNRWIGHFGRFKGPDQTFWRGRNQGLQLSSRWSDGCSVLRSWRHRSRPFSRLGWDMLALRWWLICCRIRFWRWSVLTCWNRLPWPVREIATTFLLGSWLRIWPCRRRSWFWQEWTWFLISRAGTGHQVRGTSSGRQ